MALQPRQYAFRVGLFLAFGAIMLLIVVMYAIYPKLNHGGPEYTIKFAESVRNLKKGADVLYYGVQVGQVQSVEPIIARAPDERAKVRVRVRIWHRSAGLLRSKGSELCARLEISSPIAAQLVVSLEDGPGDFGETDHEALTLATAPSTVSKAMKMLEDDIPRTVETLQTFLDQLAGTKPLVPGTPAGALVEAVQNASGLLGQLSGSAPLDDGSPIAELTVAVRSSSRILAQLAGGEAPQPDSAIAELTEAMTTSNRLLNQLAGSEPARPGSLVAEATETLATARGLLEQLAGERPPTDSSLVARVDELVASLQDSVDSLTQTIDHNELLIRGTMHDLQQAARALNQVSLRIDESRIMNWREDPEPIPGERP